MVDWIAQALARYRRASALLDSTHLHGMTTSLDLAQIAIALASEDGHMRLAARIGEVKVNLEAAQAEINQIKTDIDNAIVRMEGL